MTPANGQCLDTARQYLAAGLSPIAVRVDGSKAPIESGWQNIRADDDYLVRQFGNRDRAAIGILCGEASGGLEVLDIDRAELYELVVECIDQDAPGLTERLPVVRTGSGAYHVYYRHPVRNDSGNPPGGTKLARRETVNPDTGEVKRETLIETRAHGHQVVAPGSHVDVHPAKRRYEHIAGPPLTETPTITAEERAIILKAARSFDQMPDGKTAEADDGQLALERPPEDRNLPGDAFNRTGPPWSKILEPKGWALIKKCGEAQRWRRPGKEDEGWSATTNYDGHDLLTVFSENADPFEVWGDPPQCEVRKHYTKFAAVALLYFDGNFKAASDALLKKGYGKKGKIESGKGKSSPIATETEEEVEWEEPASLEMASVPDWPADVMFEPLHEYVAALAEETQTPEDMVAIPMLAMAAIAAAKKFRVQCPTHQEPLNLFVAVIAPPSDRKSAVMRALMEPIHNFEQAVNEELAPEIAIYESRKRTLALTLKAAESAAAKGSEGMGQMNAERDRDNLAKELAELEKNAVRKLVLAVSGDTTVERLVGLLAEQGGKLGLIDSEGGLFSMMRGKYSKNAEPAVDVYNQSYSGDPIRQHRISRPPVEVYNPALTVALYIQHEILRGMIKDSHLQGTGLLSRFWYVLPKSYVGHRVLTPDRMPAEVKGVYHHMIRKLLDLRVPTDEFGEAVPHILTMDQSATGVWLDFAERVEIGLREGGDLDDISYWAGKIPGGVARVAGTLHVIEFGAAGAISKATMEGAVKVGEYLIGHALAAFAEMKTNSDLHLAKRIARWLASTGLGAFTKRDAHQRFKSSVEKADDMDGPLRILEDAGYIRDVTEQPDKKGGRPSRQFAVNPAVAERRF